MAALPAAETRAAIKRSGALLRRVQLHLDIRRQLSGRLDRSDCLAKLVILRRKVLFFGLELRDLGLEARVLGGKLRDLFGEAVDLRLHVLLMRGIHPRPYEERDCGKNEDEDCAGKKLGHRIFRPTENTRRLGQLKAYRRRFHPGGLVCKPAWNKVN